MRLDAALARAVVLAAALAPGAAHAALVDPGAFAAAGPAITFGTDADIGATNPVVTVAGVSVAFGGSFAGQTLTGGFPDTLATRAPSAPLALAGTSTILGDLAFPDGPVLTGTPDFNGPVAVLFGQGVRAVAFTLGELGELGDASGVAVEAYAADGTSLGTLISSEFGLQQVRIADSLGRLIRGISVFNNGDIELSWAIDTLTFSLPRADVPAPAALPLLLGGILGLAAVARRRAD